MENRFTDLEIDGSFIGELTLVPEKKLRMSLLRAPQTEGEDPVTKEYDLQFNRLEEFSLNTQAAPWLEILSHMQLEQSDLLTESAKRLEKSARIVETLNHYQIECNAGQINIIAKGFSLSLVRELPFAKLNARE